jgi:hypothetical protein
MRRTEGQVVIGGSLAYVPQSPWIQNATIRLVLCVIAHSLALIVRSDNILFGADYDEARQVVRLWRS